MCLEWATTITSLRLSVTVKKRGKRGKIMKNANSLILWFIPVLKSLHEDTVKHCFNIANIIRQRRVVSLREWPVSWSWSASMCARGFVVSLHLPSRSASLFKSVVLLTRSSRITFLTTSEIVDMCAQTSSTLFFFFFFSYSFRSLSSIEIDGEKEEIERLTEWDEMGRCSIVKLNILDRIFSLFSPFVLNCS